MRPLFNELLQDNKLVIFQYVKILTRFLVFYIFSLTGAYTREYISKRANKKIDMTKTLVSSVLPTLAILAFQGKITQYLNREANLMFAFVAGYLGYNFLVTKLNNVNSFMGFIDHVLDFFRKNGER